MAAYEGISLVRFHFRLKGRRCEESPLDSSLLKGKFFITRKGELPDRAHVVGGELVLPNFGVGVIWKEHRSDAISNDSCLL